MRASTLDGLEIRRKLGKKTWGPPQPFGPDGWRLMARTLDGVHLGTVIVSVGPPPEGEGEGEWIHASMSRLNGVPTYEDLTLLHQAVFGGGWAYQVFAPPEAHVNIHPRTLHLWGKLDGSPALPNFGIYGTI